MPLNNNQRTRLLLQHIVLGLGFAAALAPAHAAGAAPCTPPAAVRDIDANSYYKDGQHAVVDPELRERNIAATQALDDYLDAVAGRASAYGSRGDVAGGRCALVWLTAWADGHAMLGKMASAQSYHQRKWTLAGLALSYARVRALADGAQRDAIDGWLRTLADATIAHADAHKGPRNNHYYWEGLAVAAVGAVTRDARQLDWGRAVFASAMEQIGDDGALPRELARGPRALLYHAFSAAPLTMLASILDVHAPRLDRLVRYTVAGAHDASAIAKAAGAPQQPLSRQAMAWLPVYGRHAGKRDLLPGNGASYPRLGGALGTANPLEHVHP